MNWETLQARFTAIAVIVWGWFGAGIKLLTALIGVVVIVAIAFVGTTWIVFFAENLLPPKDKILLEQESYGSSAAHESVKNWVLNCVGANSIFELPRNLQVSFGGFRFTDTTTTSSKVPTVQEMSAVQLSSAMLDQRTDLV